MEGCALAQAISGRVQSLVKPCEFVVDQRATRTPLSPSRGVSTVNNISTSTALLSILLLPFICCYYQAGGTAVVQWLRCCATNRKVAGSIPDGVIGIFH